MSDAPPPDQPEEPAKPGKGRPHPGAREVAAASLAAGATAKDAAAAAGCHERTVRKWLAEDPTFKARVGELRNDAIAAAMGRLSATMTAAADALRELVAHDDPHVRFKSAKAVIELGVKLKESVELEERIATLEARLAEQGGGSPR